MINELNQSNSFRAKWRDYYNRLGNRIGWFMPIWLISWAVNLLYYPTISNPIQAETFPRVSLLPLAWACVWYSILCLIRSQRNFKICASVVVGIYVLLSTIDFFLLEVYGKIFDFNIAQIFLSTNDKEASEFWETKITLDSILFPLVYVFGGIAASWGGHRLYRYFPARVRLIFSGSILLVALFSVLGLYPLLVLRHWPDKISNAVLTSPERLYVAFHIAIRDNEIMRKQLALLSQTALAPIITQDTLPPHNVVLVIGESLRPDFMSLYGYKRETTPKLDSLMKQGELLVFDDVCSSASSTNVSIANMFSTYTTDQKDKSWYNTPLLNKLASNAGYHSYWLSMQEAHGIYIALIASIARNSDEIKYLSGVDGLILNHLKTKNELVSTTKRNLFQVCHLFGSHEAYINRYPQDYARFKPEDMSEYPEDRQKELSSQYLNTVYYNDYVVSEIIKRYKDEPTLLIYLSDHGQAIYDDPDNPKLAGHSLSVPGVRVPMLCYVSPSLRTSAPQIVERIKRGVHRPIMTDVLATSILGILGIKSDDYNPKYDFTSEEYDEHRERRIVDGGKTVIVNALNQ